MIPETSAGIGSEAAIRQALAQSRPCEQPEEWRK